MQTVSVDQAKAQLSALIAKVGAVEESQTARLTAEPTSTSHLPFDFEALAAFVNAQPLEHSDSVLDMRNQDPY